MVQKIHEDFSDRVQFVTGSLTHYEINTGDTVITDAKTAWDDAIVAEANAKTSSDNSATKIAYNNATINEDEKRQAANGFPIDSEEWNALQEAISETATALETYKNSDEYIVWQEAINATIDARQQYKNVANDKGRQLINTISMRATVVLTGTFGSDMYASNIIHIAVENNSGWNTGAYPYTTSDPEYVENDRTTYLQDMLGGTWTVSAWEY
jgi:hypothetical protein